MGGLDPHEAHDRGAVCRASVACVVCLVVVLSSASAPHQVLLIVATLCSTQDNAEALVDLDLLGVIGDALRTHPALAGIVVQCVKMISSLGSMNEVRIDRDLAGLPA